MKYKEGDKVIIKKDLENGKFYGRQCIIWEMLEFRGKEMEIRNAMPHSDYYLLKGSQCGWTDEMIEGLSNKYKVELL